ncbi:MAG: SpoIIE family protein phosphatase [Clostridia bacterium]
MKTIRLKNSTSKTAGFSLAELCKYVMHFIVMLLLALAVIYKGIRPFQLGYFVALVYCRENLLYSGVIFVLSGLIVSPQINTLLINITPPLVFALAKIAHYYAKKPMKMLATNIYAGISQLPIILLNMKDATQILQAVSTVIFAQLFTYCAIVIMYAILIRGIHYAFTADEIACGLVVVLAIFLGTYQIDIYKAKLYYMLAYLTVIALLCTSQNSNNLVCVVAVGLAGAFGAGDMSVMASIVLCALIGKLFIKSNIYLAGASLILAQIFCGIFFRIADFNFFQVLLAFVGVALWLVVPQKYRKQMFAYFGVKKVEGQKYSIVNRNRKIMEKKIKNVAKVFDDMQDIVGDCKINVGGEWCKKTAEELAFKLCANCNKKQMCFEALGGDTSVLYKDILELGMNKKVITLMDIPAFFTSRCGKINEIKNDINSCLQDALRQQRERIKLSKAQELLSEQYGAISLVLQDLAQEVKENINYNSEQENRIIEELAYHNIVAKEVVIINNGKGDCEVGVTLRKKDVNKKALTLVLQKLIKLPMLQKGDEERIDEDFVNLNFVNSPQYKIICGITAKGKEGNIVSGDTKAVQKIGQDKVMVAICDGMGTGAEAEKNSASTISLIENLYKANFEGDLALLLANNFLAYANNENFTAIDILLLDLRKAYASFIKQGAVESFIKRRTNVEIVLNDALPLGIVENAKPCVNKKLLNKNDMVVMVSDGVLDALGQDKIVETLQNTTLLNPQAVADMLFSQAEKFGLKDDSTIMVVRII